METGDGRRGTGATMNEMQTMLNLAWRVGCPPEQMGHFGQGFYVPFPWALGFHAAAREADFPTGPDEIGVGGSRGPGKSHAIFCQVALDDCQRVPGLKFLYLRKIGKGAREQLDDLRRKTIVSIPHDYRRAEGVILFENGSRIITGHFQHESDVDQYLGIEYDGAAIEEDTSLTDTKRQAISDSVRSSIPGWRPRIYNSTNPGGVGHLRYKKKFITPWRMNQQAYTRFFPATVDDNPLIGPDYVRRLEQNTGWRLRAYRYGDWDIAAGQFFSTFRHEVHVREPFAIPKDWQIWLSLDYGFVHPTVVHLHAKDGDGHLYTIDEHWAQRWPVEEHAGAIRAMMSRWRIAPSRIKRFVAGLDVFAKKDDGPTIAAKYKAEGFHLTPANVDRVNGAAHLLDLLGDVERDVAPRWTIFSTCGHLIETLPLLEHDPGHPEDVLKVDVDDDGEGGDDAYDSARYGLMADGRRKMTSGNVNWYGERPGTGDRGKGTQAAGRSVRDVEEILEAYERHDKD